MSEDESPNPGADLVEMANSLDNLTDEQLAALMEESRIVIRPNGEVVIENLTPALLDVAYELNPDNPGIQCRIEEAETTDEDQAANKGEMAEPATEDLADAPGPGETHDAENPA